MEIKFALLGSQPLADVDIYIWRNGKPECLAGLGKIEFVDIKYLLEGVGCVSLEVGAETITGGLVQIIVLL